MKKIIIAFIICVFLSNPVFAQDKLITLDVKDMEIADVLRMIADQSGLNIITSKNVQGKITIDLEDVDMEAALDAILKVNNCTYIKEDNIIQVYTLMELKQKEQFARQITRVYTLKYIKAADLKPTLISLKSEKGKVEAEPRANRIIVTDTEQHIKAIEETIKEMDKKLETRVYRMSYTRPLEVQKSLLEIIPEAEGEVLVDQRTNSLIVTAPPLLLNKIDIIVRNWDKQLPQVLIEAKIMQVTLQKERVLGIDWQFKPTTKHSVILGAEAIPLPSAATYVDAFKIGVLSADDYEVTLRALESLTDANLLSSPRIVALDNEEANILIGSTEPYEILHYDSEGRLTSRDIKFIDVGIKLRVTPKISADGFVTMKIHPEVSSPRAGTVTTDALAIDSTEATTVMTVKDGYTVVLGGLIKDDIEKYVAKIPILGDIPIIKHLFRTTYSKKVKKEIIIFITPRILTGKKADLTIDEQLRSIEKEKAIQNVMEEAMHNATENEID